MPALAWFKRACPACDACDTKNRYEVKHGRGLQVKDSAMKKKYLIIPGYVRSINNNERHYVSAQQLIRLYRVNPSECVVYKVPSFLKDDEVPKSIWVERYERLNENLFKELIRLKPQWDGEYIFCVDTFEPGIEI